MAVTSEYKCTECDFKIYDEDLVFILNENEDKIIETIFLMSTHKIISQSKLEGHIYKTYCPNCNKLIKTYIINKNETELSEEEIIEIINNSQDNNLDDLEYWVTDKLKYNTWNLEGTKEEIDKIIQKELKKELKYMKMDSKTKIIFMKTKEEYEKDKKKNLNLKEEYYEGLSKKEYEEYNKIIKKEYEEYKNMLEKEDKNIEVEEYEEYYNFHLKMLKKEKKHKEYYNYRIKHLENNNCPNCNHKLSLKISEKVSCPVCGNKIIRTNVSMLD